MIRGKKMAVAIRVIWMPHESYITYKQHRIIINMHSGMHNHSTGQIYLKNSF